MPTHHAHAFAAPNLPHLPPLTCPSFPQHRRDDLRLRQGDDVDLHRNLDLFDHLHLLWSLVAFPWWWLVHQEGTGRFYNLEASLG